MRNFYSSDIWRLTEAMLLTGDRPGVVQYWKQLVSLWALDNERTADGKAMLAWLPAWQARPFYTAAELAPIVPALCHALKITDRIEHVRSPARLTNDLERTRLPKLGRYVNPMTGNHETYWIVERTRYWSGRYVTQAEFEEIYHAG